MTAIGASSFTTKFLTAFIPLFFAIDAIGILPLFMSMTKNILIDKKKVIIRQATLTSLIISVVFIYLGKGIFHFLGITIPDFKIAGGILLLVLSIIDLLFSEQQQRRTASSSDELLGVVPIGMPLIIGPGVLTTLLLNVDNIGYNATLLALVANIAIVWFCFTYSESILKVIRVAGAIAVGKVFSLLLAAIAVMMIRIGLFEIFASK
jgi:multiple antibiotic resistance protein